jgi:hypothetical protein
MQATQGTRPCAPLFAVVLMSCVGLARTDVKIVSEVSIQSGSPPTQTETPAGTQTESPASSQAGTPAPPPGSGTPGQTPEQEPKKPAPPVTVTTYYKGKMARVEVAGGPVTLYDGAANRVYTLHPDQKTYSVVSVKQALEQQATPVAAAVPGTGVRFDTSVTLEKESTNDTKSIAGKEATPYHVTASVQMHRDENGFHGGGYSGGTGGGMHRRGRFPGGGFPGGGGGVPGGNGGGVPDGGGGYPGGRGGGQSPGGSRVRRPALEMEGETWLVESTLLPAENKNALLPLLRQAVTVGPVANALNGQLGKKKLMPLFSKVTTTVTTPFGGTREPVVTTMEVKAITEETLDSALFKVPDDYKKVDAPQANR